MITCPQFEFFFAVFQMGVVVFARGNGAAGLSGMSHWI